MVVVLPERRTWVAPAALLAFAVVAAAVALRTTGAFDAWAAEAVRRLASPAADRVALVATALASGPATLLLVAGVSLALLRVGARRSAAVVAAAWLSSALGVAVLKVLAGRARPSFEYTVAALPSKAFPSGHAMNAVVVFGLVAVVAARRFPRARPALLSAALALAILGGLSRVYLGVHHPSDVVGGWAGGAAVLALLEAALPPAGHPAAARPTARDRS